MNVWLAEITHQTLVRFEIDFLVAEENNATRNDGIVHLFHLAIGKRPRQIDIADFGPDMRRARRDGDGVVLSDLLSSVVSDLFADLAHGAISWRDLLTRSLGAISRGSKRLKIEPRS